MQQIRPIAAKMPGQIQAQALVGIHGDLARLDAAGQSLLHALLRNIGDQFIAFVQTGELVQKIADINFVSREVAADRVRVN